jgi:hypothetical protein
MSNVANYAEQGGALDVIGGELRLAAGGRLTVALGSATASAGAATASGIAGKITSEALTTAQNAVYTLTLTNDQIAAGDVVVASVANGTNTQGTPIIGRVTPSAGQVVVLVINQHPSAQALNGTIVVSYAVVKAA